jgi:hypothetical protein
LFPEIDLINGHLLDHRPGFSDEFHDLPRFLLVRFHARPDKHAFGAKPAGSHAGHSRVHAEFAGLIASGADHAALRWWRSTITGLPRNDGLSRCSIEA